MTKMFSLAEATMSRGLRLAFAIVLVCMILMGGCESNTEPKTVSNPTFSLAGGAYTSSVTVTISCATEGSVIRYTTNGTDPTESSTQYSSPIGISSTTTIKARAYRSGWTPSSIANATYTITGTVATPTFSPGGGTYTSSQNVNISCATSGATIRYTTNGNDPTESSTQYTGPINISTTTTLKARAYLSGWTPSSIVNAAYTITGSVATPTFNPGGGTYTSAQNVSISCTTIGATIRYTTNGTNPTETSTQYTGPINISTTTTLKARAYLSGWTPSSMASATFSFFIFVQGGTFNPTSTYSVSLSSYYIEKYEVTDKNYRYVMDRGILTDSIRPVAVSWFEAIEYCNRRSTQEGLLPCYSYGSYGTNPSNWPWGWYQTSSNHTNVSCNWDANGYRLPTEMEWMFAAKGGNQSEGYTYSGSNTIDYVAWYNMNSSARTHDVGELAGNELGIFDMSGNVWEHCWDIYDSYPTGNHTDPRGPVSGSYRVHRGGSYSISANWCTVSSRQQLGAAPIYTDLGFRVVKRIP